MIYEDHAGLQARDVDGAGAAQISCKNSPAKTVNTSVGSVEKSVLIVRYFDGGDRTKKFLVGGGHAGSYVGQQGGGIKSTRASRTAASDHEVRAKRPRAFYLGVQFIAQVGAGQGPQLRIWRGGVADAITGKGYGEESDKLIGHASMYDKAFGRDTTLAVVNQSGGGAKRGGNR